jgi:hypothetical protein
MANGIADHQDPGRQGNERPQDQDDVCRLVEPGTRWTLRMARGEQHDRDGDGEHHARDAGANTYERHASLPTRPFVFLIGEWPGSAPRLPLTPQGAQQSTAHQLLNHGDNLRGEHVPATQPYRSRSAHVSRLTDVQPAQISYCDADVGWRREVPSSSVG